MRKIIYFGICIMVSCSVFSCKIGKRYSRPDLNLPLSLDSMAVGSISLDELKWWNVYTDTVLQGLIRRTLNNNKDMLIAAAKVKEMREARRIAKAGLFPELDGKVAANREYDESPGNTFEAKGMLSWEIDLWGKLRWGNQAALAEYLQTVEGQKALQLTLVADVAQTYFELLSLDRELAIVRQTLSARHESVRLAKLRFEGGLTSETSLRQAEVELARTQTLVPGLEQQIRLKENEITLLCGQYPGLVNRGKTLAQQDLPAELPVGLSSGLLERRPDIRQAEYELKAAHARVGIAYVNRFPRLTLTGHYGLESSGLSDFLKTPYFYLAGELVAPLFNMGKNRANLRAARAVFEQVAYNYEKVVLTAFTEVNDALISFRNARQIYEARKNLEESAYQYLELAKLQHINGIISYIDVLDAQRGFFDAQIGVNDAIENELLTMVQLYKVLGGGYAGKTNKP